MSIRSKDDLDQLAILLAKDLQAVAQHLLARFAGFEVGLLEIFKYEREKFQRLHYCDYEMAYVSYVVAFRLRLQFHDDSYSVQAVDLKKYVNSTLIANKDAFKDISENMEQLRKDQSPAEVDEEVDALTARFRNLKGVPNGPLSPTLLTNGTTNGRATSPASRVRSQKYPDLLTAKSLGEIIQKDPKSVLLIDFRVTKEFEVAHINYSNIVNIHPADVTSLYELKGASNVTDADLEERLQMHIPPDQYARFKERQKYELIVIYNQNYGIKGTKVSDKFDLLKYLLLDESVEGRPANSPFKRLIDLLCFRNMYISSRLKNFPCILYGGLEAWQEQFGVNSVSKVDRVLPLKSPQLSLARGSPSSLNSMLSLQLITPNNTGSEKGYLRSFDAYLTSARLDISPITPSPITPTPNGNGFYTNPSSYIKPPSATVTETSYIRPKLTPTPELVQQQPPVNELKRKSSFSQQLQKTFSSSSSSSLPVSKSSALKEPTTLDSTSFLIQYSTGLTNLGNSCYMNCILQCLGATPQLTRFFFTELSPQTSLPVSSLKSSYRDHINVHNKLGTKGILTTSFVKLLGDMFQKNGKSFTPTEFKKIMGSLSPGRQFATFDQQDCIEFLTFLLDSLHEDLNQALILSPDERKQIMELPAEQEKIRETIPIRLASTIEWERYLKLNISIIVDYFEGQFLSQLKCLECGHTSTTYNSFSILSLPIPQKLSKTGIVLLQDCLEEFTTTELLDDDNQWHCPVCRKFVKSTKKLTITRLPQILIIHFKRFKLLPTGYFNKLVTFIKYPVGETLDLTKYWPPAGTPGKSDIPADAYISKEAEEQYLSGFPTRNQEPPFRYKLYGVANHYGNLTTGHYTSYVYKRGKGWCYFDDAKVSEKCKESQVMNKNAYCLFYQRI